MPLININPSDDKNKEKISQKKCRVCELICDVKRFKFNNREIQLCLKHYESIRNYKKRIGIVEDEQYLKIFNGWRYELNLELFNLNDFFKNKIRKKKLPDHIEVIEPLGE